MMPADDLITLIDETYTQDDIKEQVPTETLTMVWAHLQSATRAEWESAGQNGLQPSLVAVTPSINYGGQKTAEIGGKRYAIYKAFQRPNSDEVELYMRESVGDE